MFFKNLKKKQAKYKIYFHKYIIKQLRRNFEAKNSLLIKLKQLNSLFYKIKYEIRKKRMLKFKKYKHRGRYRLSINSFKNRKNFLYLFSGIILTNIKNSIKQKNYKLNKKKLIFVYNKYKKNILNNFYLNTKIKYIKEIKSNWKKDFSKKYIKINTYWKLRYYYIKRKSRCRFRKKVRLANSRKRLTRIKKLRFDIKYGTWYKKLVIYKKHILKKKLYSSEALSKYSKQIKNYKNKYYRKVFCRRKFNLEKITVYLKKIRNKKLFKKFTKYTSVIVKKRPSKQKLSTLATFIGIVNYLPIRSLKYYLKHKKKFKIDKRMIRHMYIKRIHIFRKAIIAIAINKRKIAGLTKKKLKTIRGVILHKKRNKTPRYIRRMLKKKKIKIKIKKKIRKNLRRVRRIKCHKFRLKRFKKIKFFYNKKQLLFINFLNLQIKNKKYKTWIFNKSFLTQRMHKKTIIAYYKQIAEIKKSNYVRWKKRRKRVYAFNFWKKKLTVLKNARQIHWNLFTKKTLKKRRYRIFLKKQLRKKSSITNDLIHYFSIKFKFSTNFWYNFRQLYKKYFSIKIKTKRIYQFPIHIMFWNFLNSYHNKQKKTRIKIRNWIKKTKRIRRRFWMNTKKKIPKYFYKQTLKTKKTLNSIHFDYLTNYFCIIKKIRKEKTLLDVIEKNNMIKLHNIRYKA